MSNNCVNSVLTFSAVTLYDKPPGRFKQLSDEERLEFLKRFSLIYPEIEMVINPEPGTKKPGILVSTTSWTEDEDFRILLTALKGNRPDYLRLTC